MVSFIIQGCGESSEILGLTEEENRDQSVEVLGCSEDSVNGQYFPTSAEVIPPGFQKVELEASQL